MYRGRFIVSDVSTMYFLQIWSGAQSVMMFDGLSIVCFICLSRSDGGRMSWEGQCRRIHHTTRNLLTLCPQNGNKLKTIDRCTFIIPTLFIGMLIKIFFFSDYSIHWRCVVLVRPNEIALTVSNMMKNRQNTSNSWLQKKQLKKHKNTSLEIIFSGEGRQNSKIKKNEWKMYIFSFAFEGCLFF